MPHHAKHIVSKDIIKRLIEDISKYIFHIELQSIEILETQLQRIEERRADIVVKVSQQGRVYLLHLEIQNNNCHEFPLRNLRYYTDIASQFPGFEIEQYLIYIGKDKLTIPNRIQKPGLDYRYHIVDMQQIDCDHFLQPGHPDALILAILCDFKGRDEREIIQFIIQELKCYYQDNEKAFHDSISKLEVLSLNRDLNTTVREEEQMLSVRWEELPSFEIGKEEGLKEGMEKGKIEGKIEEKIETVLKAHQAGIDLKTISQISGLTIEEIQKIMENQ